MNIQARVYSIKFDCFPATSGTRQTNPPAIKDGEKKIEHVRGYKKKVVSKLKGLSKEGYANVEEKTRTFRVTDLHRVPKPERCNIEHLRFPSFMTQ